ncbi:CU044_5270 family protein [Streptomyces fagopyri]|uniref:CU044_5270 family protein n=1 Tax=Streptomyces fagopyri TaxID=2662397 RepID=UPI001D17B1EA|nr:CU044_5270 family protein [Streptomyces fagopyri]
MRRDRRCPGNPRRHAAAAALATSGGVVARLPDGHSDGGREVLSAKASAAALELAAATVAKNDGTEPSAKQWVYEKSTFLDGSRPQTSEQWTRWDGTGDARLPGIPGGGSTKGFDPNRLQVWYGPDQEEKWKERGYDDRSQRQFYRFLATLPSDPDQMMRRILKEHAIGAVKGETRAEHDRRELNVLFRSLLVPPKVQAGMFRALTKIPGTPRPEDLRLPGEDRPRRREGDNNPWEAKGFFMGASAPTSVIPTHRRHRSMPLRSPAHARFAGSATSPNQQEAVDVEAGRVVDGDAAETGRTIRSPRSRGTRNASLTRLAQLKTKGPGDWAAVDVQVTVMPKMTIFSEPL